MKYIPEFTLLDEVKSFQNDEESANREWHKNSMSGWHISKKWADVFKKHLEILTPIAINGDALAQYSVGAIYLIDCLYDNEEEAISNSKRNRVEMSKWLELAAKQGVLAAIDNLISSGIGMESDRLRSLYEANINEPDTNIEEWKNNMQLIYKLAYVQNS